MKEAYYILGDEVAEFPMGLRGFPLPHFVLQKPTLKTRRTDSSLRNGRGGYYRD